VSDHRLSRVQDAAIEAVSPQGADEGLGHALDSTLASCGPGSLVSAPVGATVEVTYQIAQPIRCGGLSSLTQMKTPAP
jgi:hypothetical protein